MQPFDVRPAEPADFLRLWRRLYGDDEFAVTPLKQQVAADFAKDDPYLARGEREAFVAADADGPLACAIASWDDQSSTAFERPTGFFSHFESVDDHRVTARLFAALRKWLGERGADALVGPMSPKIADPRGILVEGGGRPLYGMPYTPRYYERLLTEVGLWPARDLLEFFFPVQPPYERLQRLAVLAEKRFPGIVVRPLDLSHLPQELERVVDIYNDAWKDNWGFIPLHADELAHAALDLKSFYRSEYGTIVELDGRCIAFQMLLPDVNAILHRLKGRLWPIGWFRLLRGLRRPPVFRGFFIGVRPSYRWSGVDALMASRVLNVLAPRLDVERMHIAYVLEDNYWWRREVENLVGGDLGQKRYRVFEGRCR